MAEWPCDVNVRIENGRCEIQDLFNPAGKPGCVWISTK